MIDIIGSITLTALFAVYVAILTIAIPIDSALRPRFAAAVAAWFAGVGFLAAFGVFSREIIGTVALGMAILTPIILFLVASARSSTVRRLALSTPLAVLVALHAGRALGVFFLLLFEAGRLPPTFAMAAGWGDIAVSVAALPLAWAIQHQVTGWRPLTFAWNLLGFADLVTAVTLGVGSAANSPLRFIFESPNSGAVASLPWVLIPGVMVPLYLLMHFAIFGQLVRATVARRHPPHDGGLAWQSSGR